MNLSDFFNRLHPYYRECVRRYIHELSFKQYKEELIIYAEHCQINRVFRPKKRYFIEKRGLVVKRREHFTKDVSIRLNHLIYNSLFKMNPNYEQKNNELFKSDTA